MTRLMMLATAVAVGGSVGGRAAAQPTPLDRVHADLFFTPGSGPDASGGWAAAQIRVEGSPPTFVSAADAVIVANNTPTTLVNRPAGSQFDFIGTPAGSPIWLLRQSNNQASQTFLGVRSAGSGFTSWEPGSGLAAAPWVELTVRKQSGLGEFAMWQTGSVGGIDKLVSTADPLATLFNNKIYTVGNGHDHFNFSFTQAGTYEIAFDVRANTSDGFLLSDPTRPLTFTFEVQPVPEPALLTAAAALGTLAVRRARRPRCARAM